MTEYIVNAINLSVLSTVAKSSGFFRNATIGPKGQEIPGQIIRQDRIDSGGSWYFNFVGEFQIPTGDTIEGPLGPVPEYAPLPGVWARLRVNGEITNRLRTLITRAKGASIDVYSLEPIGPVDDRGNVTLVWTKDGVTPSPDYIANIGIIL